MYTVCRRSQEAKKEADQLADWAEQWGVYTKDLVELVKIICYVLIGSVCVRDVDGTL